MDMNIRNSGKESEDQIIDQAQSILYKWNNNLKITRGQLKVEKCYWTL